MAGHSKWANIKHKKSANDAKKSKLFTSISKDIVNAVRSSGCDTNPSTNSLLRSAIEDAKQAGLQKAKIEYAISRGSGKSMASGELINYNAKFKDAFLIIEAITDNRNRSFGVIKTALHKMSAEIVEPGSCSHIFEKVGIIKYSKELLTKDHLESIILDFDIMDHFETDENHTFIVEYKNVHQISKDIKDKLKIDPDENDIIWQPTMYADLTDENQETLLNLVDNLLDLDDVARVFYNVKDDK